MENSNLTNANFHDVSLIETVMDNSKLIGTSFDKSSAMNDMVHKATITRKLSLKHAELAYTTMKNIWLLEADFSDAKLYGTDLSGAMMIDARFSKAKIYGANMSNAFLIAAMLDESKDRSSENVSQEEKQIGIPASHPASHDESTIVSGVDLTSSNLGKMQFGNAFLSGVNVDADKLASIKAEGINLYGVLTSGRTDLPPRFDDSRREDSKSEIKKRYEKAPVEIEEALDTYLSTNDNKPQKWNGCLLNKQNKSDENTGFSCSVTNDDTTKISLPKPDDMRQWIQY
jgi:uncharacterized protein YjbI with pentapeptide repeats